MAEEKNRADAAAGSGRRRIILHASACDLNRAELFSQGPANGEVRDRGGHHQFPCRCSCQPIEWGSCARDDFSADMVETAQRLAALTLPGNPKAPWTVADIAPTPDRPANERHQIKVTEYHIRELDRARADGSRPASLWRSHWTVCDRAGRILFPDPRPRVSLDRLDRLHSLTLERFPFLERILPSERRPQLWWLLSLSDGTRIARELGTPTLVSGDQDNRFVKTHWERPDRSFAPIDIESQGPALFSIEKKKVQVGVIHEAGRCLPRHETLFLLRARTEANGSPWPIQGPALRVNYRPGSRAGSRSASRGRGETIRLHYGAPLRAQLLRLLPFPVNDLYMVGKRRGKLGKLGKLGPRLHDLNVDHCPSCHIQDHPALCARGTIPVWER